MPKIYPTDKDKDQLPSKLFLRFADWYLSNGKADSEHYHTVSLKNCLLWIPGSHNSKNMSQVKIVQKWNGDSKIPLDVLYYAYWKDPKSKKLKKMYIGDHMPKNKE